MASIIASAIAPAASTRAGGSASRLGSIPALAVQLPRARAVRRSDRRMVVKTSASSPVDSLKSALSFYPPIMYSGAFQAVTVPSVLAIAFVAYGGTGTLDGDALKVAQIAATSIGFIHLASGAGAGYIASEKGMDVAPVVAKNLLVGFPAFLETLLAED